MRPCLVVPCLFLGSLVAFGQQARTASELRDQAEPFVAARLLVDLTEGAENRGVDLVGDVDDDGDVDLLAFDHLGVGSQDPDGVQVWLKVGPEEYVHAHTLAFTTSNREVQFHSFQLADVTADGMLDLVYIRPGHPSFPYIPSRAIVHPGLGDGSFGGELRIIANSHIFVGLAVGDCDGDGDSDLLLHDSENSLDSRDALAWWRYEGGVFVSGSPLLLDNLSTQLWLQALDIDGDARADAVGAINYLGVIQFFRTVNGAPTLDATIPLPGVIAASQKRLRAGDLDGDGDDDALVVVDDVWNDLFHAQPILNEGSGFAAAPLQSVPSSFSTAFDVGQDGEIVDWDEDGDLDYVSPTFAWLENTGGASFSAAGMLASGTSGNNSTVLVADLDADGHLDVVSGWSSFHGDGTLPRRSSVDSVPYQSLSSLATSATTRLEDWEGDGDLDCVARDVLFLNDGLGSFAERSAERPYFPPPHVGFAEVGWGDFDGDGFRDVVAASRGYPSAFLGMKLFTGTESGAYVLSPTVPSPIEMTAQGSLTGDIDGDGDLDILTRDGFWQNDGVGRFGTSKVPAYVGTLVGAVDLERDGDLDLVVAGAAVGTNMRLLLNLGGLSFEESLIGSSGSAASFADLDEDGDLDLAVTYPDDDIVRVFAQDSAGHLAAPIVLSVSGADGPVGQVDVDGDGRLDLVVGGTLDGLQSTFPLRLLSTWIRGPGLSFVEGRIWVTGIEPLGFGDIDRDGDVDCFGREPHQGGGALRLFENLRFDGPGDGFAVQYGLDAATSGTGGIRPVLGSGAHVRPGHFARFVIGRGRGGASGVLLAGDARSDVLEGGIRRLVDSPMIPRTFVLDGMPGAPGRGSLVLRVPVIPALVGLTRDFQVILVDPGASGGLSATNGLEVRFGD